MNYDGLSQMESCFHKKRQLTKGPHVVRPFVEIHVPHDIYYQRWGKVNDWTDFSLCLDTARRLAWQNEGRNRWFGLQLAWHPRLWSGLKIWQCECNRCGFNTHSIRIAWMQLQCAFKPDLVWKGLKSTDWCLSEFPMYGICVFLCCKFISFSQETQ